MRKGGSELEAPLAGTTGQTAGGSRSAQPLRHVAAYAEIGLPPRAHPSFLFCPCAEAEAARRSEEARLQEEAAFLRSQAQELEARALQELQEAEQELAVSTMSSPADLSGLYSSRQPHQQRFQQQSSSLAGLMVAS